MTKHLKFSALFLVVFLLNCYAEYETSFNLKVYVKPLIVIALAAYLVMQTGLKGRFLKRVFAGLVFSWIGDMLLLFAQLGQGYFIAGLFAFLIAHICYSSAFFLDFKSNVTAPKTYGHLMLFVMGVFSVSYYSFIRDSLGDLKLPVLAYVFVISLMAILAGYRYTRVSGASFTLILCGALLFVISDASLAFDKFVSPFEHAGLLIMGSYMLAQYFITAGAVERKLVTGQ